MTLPAQSSARQSPARRTRLTPEREGELYEAVLGLLRENGYDALTMDAVAARSRCSKATLYRQWQGKPRLVAAALRHHKHMPFSLDALDTGSLRGDLRELARRFGGTRKDVELIRAIGPALHRDPDLARAVHDAVCRPELDVLRQIIDRAVGRGEVDPENPALEFVPHALTGAVFARPFVELREADTGYLERYLEAVVLPVLVRD